MHEYVASIGSKSKAIALWFVFTGCDTVSSFAGRGKTSAWKVWKVDEEIVNSFIRYAIFSEVYSISVFLKCSNKLLTFYIIDYHCQTLRQLKKACSN